MLGLFMLLGRDRPENLGLPAYGEASVQPVPPRPTVNFIALSVAALQLAARRGVFWMLAATFFICGISSFGLTQTHFVPFCGDLGFSLVASAWLLTVIGVCDLIGTIGSRVALGPLRQPLAARLVYGFRGLSLVWLVYGDVSLAGLTIFAVVYGLDFIATVPPTVKLAAGAFGREMGPAVVSWVFAAHQLGVGVMAYATGISRDALGTYMPAFLVAGVLCLVAAVAFVLVRRPEPTLAAA
jgi:predicted MFS family arabinose efflux permease